MSSDTTTDSAKDALMKIRAQQMALRGVAAAAVSVGYNASVNGFPLTMGAHQKGALKTAAAVLAADAVADYGIDGSAWGKALGVTVPEVAVSEPVLAGVFQYLIERFGYGSGGGTSLITEFAVGAIASKVSEWVTMQLNTL